MGQLWHFCARRREPVEESDGSAEVGRGQVRVALSHLEIGVTEKLAHVVEARRGDAVLKIQLEAHQRVVDRLVDRDAARLAAWKGIAGPAPREGAIREPPRPAR